MPFDNIPPYCRFTLSSASATNMLSRVACKQNLTQSPDTDIRSPFLLKQIYCSWKGRVLVNIHPCLWQFPYPTESPLLYIYAYLKHLFAFPHTHQRMKHLLPKFLCRISSYSGMPSYCYGLIGILSWISN